MSEQEPIPELEKLHVKIKERFDNGEISEEKYKGILLDIEEVYSFASS